MVWEKISEKYRLAVRAASMLLVDGRVQLEGDVVHLVAYKLENLTSLLSSLGQRDVPFPAPFGRADIGRSPMGPDPRGTRPAWDIYILDLHIDTLKQKTRDFR